MLEEISEETLTSGYKNTSWGNGYAVRIDTPEKLVGKTLQHVEALGLPQKQEDAVKDLIRRSIYGEFTEVYIDAVLYSAIIDANYRIRRKEAIENASSVPPTGVSLKDLK